MKDAKETERDIVRALEGSDAEMRAFVASLRAAPQARTAEGFTADVMAAVRAGEAERARRPFWSALTRLAAALPVAAGLALLFAVGSVFQRPAPAWTTARLVACQRPDGTFTASSAAPYVQAFAVTVLAKDPTVAPRARFRRGGAGAGAERGRGVGESVPQRAQCGRAWTGGGGGVGPRPPGLSAWDALFADAWDRRDLAGGPRPRGKGGVHAPGAFAGRRPRLQRRPLRRPLKTARGPICYTVACEEQDIHRSG